MEGRISLIPQDTLPVGMAQILLRDPVLGPFVKAI